jgi:3-carboxy-cis,cis-muconate cycloisomerase
MIFDRFLASPEVMRVLDARAFVQAMLDFEAALARAQAAAGAIPASAGETIAGACRADRFDVDAIVADGARAGTLVIPLAKALTAAVAQVDAEAALYVHWGGTSQDVLDTAQVLVARRALALIDRDLSPLVATLLQLAREHGDAPQLGRTLLQPAQVISFGFKLAGWVAPLVRAQARLRRAGAAALQLQLGGAVGTRAALGDSGDAVLAHMAQALDLRAPPAAWHTQRDELVALGCELGLLAGSLGKIAKDISLMAQGEVGELAEPSGGGRGGSSAMPHKRNPVACMVALAAAVRAPQHVAALLAAMPQEHERGLGNWQAELAELGGLLASVHGALAALGQAAGGLHVDRARMRRNIDALQGLVFAEALSMRIAQEVGKTEAHHRVEALSQQAVASGRPLRDVAASALEADDRLRAAIPLAELQSLFEADEPARRASAMARPQLATLAVQADDLRTGAPWQRWLPQPDQGQP